MFNLSLSLSLLVFKIIFKVLMIQTNSLFSILLLHLF